MYLERKKYWRVYCRLGGELLVIWRSDIDQIFEIILWGAFKVSCNGAAAGEGGCWVECTKGTGLPEEFTKRASCC